MNAKQREIVDLLKMSGSKLVRKSGKGGEVWRLPNGMNFITRTDRAQEHGVAHELADLRRKLGDVAVDKLVKASKAAPKEEGVKKTTTQLTMVTKEPKTTVELVTPAMAAKWLESNTKNRPLRQGHVDFLASEITSGAWQLTNAGVAFDTDGALLDGQHRLWAVVLADKAVRMNVTRGLDAEAQRAIDVNGAPRTLGDVLNLAGDTSGKRRSEIIGLIRNVAFQRYGKCGFDEAQEIANGSFKEGIDFALSLPQRIRSGPAAVRGAIAIAYKMHPVKVGQFAEQVWYGLELTRTAPAYLLRSLLLGETDSRSRVDRRSIALKTLRAVLAHINGETIKNLYAAEDVIVHFAKVHGVSIKPKTQAAAQLVARSKKRAAKTMAEA